MISTPQPTSYRDLVHLSMPLLLSYLLEQLIGMTDVAFLGRYNEIALGAAAISTVAFLTISTIGVGYCYGLQAFLARRYGEQRYSAIGDAFYNGSAFIVGVGLIIAIVSMLFSGPIMERLCSSPEVARDAADYLFWRSISLPLAFLAGALRAFYVTTLSTRIITVSSIVMLLVNVVFNYPLIFGFGPIPAMGIAGAAISSSIAEVSTVLFLVLWTVNKVDLTKFSFNVKPRLRMSLQRSLFSVGAWLSLQEAVAFGTWLLFFLTVEHISALGLAVSNITRQCAAFIFMVLHAYGAAAGALCSNLLGQRREAEMLETAKKGLILCFVTLAPVLLICALMPITVLSIFTNIEEVLDNSLAVFYVMLAGFLIGTPSMYYTYVTGEIGASKISSFAMVTASIVYVIYMLWIGQATQSVPWVWTADAVFYAMNGLILVYFLTGNRWRKETDRMQ